jgi:transcriptional antiterminator NusG
MEQEELLVGEESPEEEIIASATEPETEAEALENGAETTGDSPETPEVEGELEGESEEFEGLVPPEQIPEGAAWYVVHTYSGYENKVKQTLEYRVESTGMQDHIFRVVVPVEEEVDIKEGQRRVIERRIFPGYVFVQMLMNDEAWYMVQNTPGVTGFVGSGTKPTPLRDEEVERILRRIEAEEPTVRVSFREGQRVRIVDGPFTDFHGTVDEIDMQRGKVRLLVSFFGRETPVELDLLQVEKG